MERIGEGFKERARQGLWCTGKLNCQVPSAKAGVYSFSFIQNRISVHTRYLMDTSIYDLCPGKLKRRVFRVTMTPAIQEILTCQMSMLVEEIAKQALRDVPESTPVRHFSATYYQLVQDQFMNEATRWRVKGVVYTFDQHLMQLSDKVEMTVLSWRFRHLEKNIRAGSCTRWIVYTYLNSGQVIERESAIDPQHRVLARLFVQNKGLLSFIFALLMCLLREWVACDTKKISFFDSTKYSKLALLDLGSRGQVPRNPVGDLMGFFLNIRSNW